MNKHSYNMDIEVQLSSPRRRKSRTRNTRKKKAKKKKSNALKRKRYTTSLSPTKQLSTNIDISKLSTLSHRNKRKKDQSSISNNPPAIQNVTIIPNTHDETAESPDQSTSPNAANDDKNAISIDRSLSQSVDNLLSIINNDQVSFSWSNQEM